MSITINDVLELSSLKGAQLLAGKGNLKRQVSSISVSEFPEFTEKEKLKTFHADYFGRELLISAFAHIRDDVDKQCQVIRLFAENGLAGLILFYVGVILPNVDPAVIKTAEDANFVLICMPKDRVDLRYSEVIYEVMELIIKDQNEEVNLKNDFLEQISHLPAKHRNIDQIMQMISGQFRATVILSDSVNNPLNAVIWPRTSELDIRDVLRLSDNRPRAEIMIDSKTFWLQSTSFITSKSILLYVHTIKKDQYLRPEIVRQIGETLQISINLWNEGYGENALPKLLHAILQNEVHNIRRLAAMFRTDVKKFKRMLIILPEESEEPQRILRVALAASREMFDGVQNTLSDIYQGNVVILPAADAENSAFYETAKELQSLLGQRDCPSHLVICDNIPQISHASQIYALVEKAFKTARVIFPHKRIFDLSDMRFSADCLQIADNKEAANDKLRILEELSKEDVRCKKSLVETISVYLLDTDSNIKETAQLMYLHRNSIKYRLDQIEVRLGLSLEKTSNLVELYYALALNRILRSGFVAE
jgi:DNA-binding PucR family transcriptional regulator